MASRLPLEQFLEALVAWDDRPAPETLAAVGAALEDVARTAGVAGIWVELDAPPLHRLTLGAGSLVAGPPARTAGAQDGAGAGSAPRAGGEADVPVETVLPEIVGAPSVEGAVAVAGEDGARGVALRAVLRSLELVWTRAEARIAAKRLEALDDAARAVAGELELERVLQVIVDRVRPLVGARYAALGIVGRDGRFDRFITSGIGDEERARIGHIPVGLGLLGHVVHVGRSVRVTDLTEDPRRYGFPRHHPVMHSFLGVPVSVLGTSVGNLYLTEKQGGGVFTDADERLVETFARHAGISIERARFHEQVQQLVIADERERIGRDLHDGIIQSLYAVGLSLEDVPELIDGQRAEALDRLDHAIESIHATIRDIRQFIVGLQPESLATGELDAALGALADEARQQGIPNVYLEVTDAALVSPLQATEVVQVAREAISNAVRHSAASRLRIRLRREEEDGVVLTVEDDGHGFDPSVAPGQEHRGLGNLRARARRLGGDVTVESSIGWGTRVSLRIGRGTG